MKCVNGMLSLAVVLGLLSGCGRQTNSTFWNGSAWVSDPWSRSASTSSSGSSAASSSSAVVFELYAFDTSGSSRVFSVNQTTGFLTLTSSPKTTAPSSASAVQNIYNVGSFTYMINPSNHGIDIYASNNLNVAVQSVSVANGFTSIALASQ